MNQKQCTEWIEEFESFLVQEEKSKATTEKYLHDIKYFFKYLSDRTICKENTVAYKEYLAKQYAPASVNSMLVALNSFLRFIGLQDCCVKLVKIQRQIFSREDKELSIAEYKRLVKAAANTRMSLVIQTVCGTGIRVSELQHITVEAVRAGKAIVSCKNKTRVIFIPASIQKLLKEYIKKNSIAAGAVFVSKKGNPLDRRNIWRDMKALCEQAGVSPQKVFPHNLRHLFARTFYSLEKDIVRLADLLGHSSIETTRIYTIETGNEHRQRLERVGRLLRT